MIGSATARACSNIAFIKYWGNQDDRLRIPANSSLSMNLSGLYTETTVIWDSSLIEDKLVLNGIIETHSRLQRVSRHLDFLRERLNVQSRACVESKNNFPTGAGIASSASGFAALTVAAVAASGNHLTERELSVLARIGSGSAARSIPSGFVEWHKGDSRESSFAESIAGPEHWDLVDIIAVISTEHKKTGSQQGHTVAGTSDLQAARVAGAQERLLECKSAILNRDFMTLARITEHESNLMHAVMMTGKPPLFYWEPASISIMKAIRQWREEGLKVCYTLDAGPNVHCICERIAAQIARSRLDNMPDVLKTLVATPGEGARVIEKNG